MKRIAKYLKRIGLSILVLTLLCIIFRGPLYRLLVSYSVAGKRQQYTVRDKRFSAYLDSTTTGFRPADVRDLIRLSLKITAKRLNYTASRNDNDPNRLFQSKNAHCVGYAAFFSTTCSYLLDKFGYSKDWKSEPFVGLISLFGVNVHSYFESPFFKDHDFCRIANPKTGEQYYVDPTVHDYLDIDFVRSGN